MSGPRMNSRLKVKALVTAEVIQPIPGPYSIEMLKDLEIITVDGGDSLKAGDEVTLVESSLVDELTAERDRALALLDKWTAEYNRITEKSLEAGLLERGCEILGEFIKGKTDFDGSRIEFQDGEFWLFDGDGEGLMGAKTIVGLLKKMGAETLDD